MSRHGLALLLTSVLGLALPAAAELPSFGEHDFTLCAWVRTTAGGVIVSKSAESGAWACLGKAFFVRGGHLGFDFGCIGVCSGRAAVADGAWHHAAVTYRDAAHELAFFADGQPDGTAAVKGNADLPDDLVRFGAAAPGLAPPNALVGDLDEVRIYDRALTAAQLGDLAAGKPIAGAAGAWSFEAAERGYDVIGATPLAGVTGQALHFDGTARVELGDREARRAKQLLAEVDPAALRRAIEDLTRTFGERYPQGEAYLERLKAFEQHQPATVPEAEAFLALRREALLANPLLDFDRLLLIRRGEGQMGLPQNWESNSSLPMTGYDNELAVMEPRTGQMRSLYTPPGGRFVGDVDLHFDASRMLLSMPGDNGRWQVHELSADGAHVRQLPLITQPDVDNYDACYLPDGRITFTSTAPFVGVPCVTGASHVSNLYLYSPADGGIRRTTFEQDHDWCPTVLEDGRVMYLRWEYSDIPHFVSRIVFTMNPDGTDQRERYGSNSYWPNSLFYARPIPGDTGRFVGIVGGHHDVPRMGELVLFDTAKGRREADGVVQRIPGWGKKVEPKILDGLVGASWPKFLHPWPLSSNYFLVACKPSPARPWGIYLADVFDNLLPLKEIPGSALLEPIPLRPRALPPAIPDRVRPGASEATMVIDDIYHGGGLDGVPRGTVKSLRLLTYHFAYHGVGGQVNRVGLDGPWDIKRLIGTVPVEPDGSACFNVPANTPISMQPLDAQGQAVQLMRSWTTAMPGEVQSCVGCHESQSSTPKPTRPAALRKTPAAIRPWYGPTRGFSFRREVQPVLDRFCVDCHNGAASPDFRDAPDVHPQGRDAGYNNGTHFPPSYLALRSFVRTPTMESDIHLLNAGEYTADTTRLVRMLRKGHHGVELSAEAWDRLITWIDLNTPAHGTWGEIVGSAKIAEQSVRRRAMDALYAGRDEDAEAVGPAAVLPPAPRRTPVVVAAVRDSAGAPSPVMTPAAPETRTVDLGDGQVLTLVKVPAGSFAMGDAAGCDDERPTATVQIPRAYWIGRCEVTNAQYARCDPRHDSRLETGDFLQFSETERGYLVNGPTQPVCRVSQREAVAFCAWLGKRAGLRCALPTEAQWEYACRAGSTTPLWYGGIADDFAKVANLADAKLRNIDTFGWGLPSGAVPPWRPAAERVDDGYHVSAPVGGYQPNAWGLYDMAGNVAEWTGSAPAPYPYADRTAGDVAVVRGGSWYDRPAEARSAYRAAYPTWRRVYDVGFRVVVAER